MAARENKAPAELLAEIKSNFDGNIAAVRAAPDDLLHKNFRAPWEVQGEVGDVIVMSLEGHLGMHLVDLRAAVA